MQELRPMKRRNKAHKLSGWEAVLGRCFWHLDDTKHICGPESNTSGTFPATPQGKPSENISVNKRIVADSFVKAFFCSSRVPSEYTPCAKKRFSSSSAHAPLIYGYILSHKFDSIKFR